MVLGEHTINNSIIKSKLSGMVGGDKCRRREGKVAGQEAQECVWVPGSRIEKVRWEQTPVLNVGVSPEALWGKGA